MGDPTWMYRRGQFGREEAKIFDSDDLPAEGWYDSPAKIPAAPPKPKAKRKTAAKKAPAPADAA